MEIITKSELKVRYSDFLTRIKEGAVFIHPTDTIYGLSCNANNKKSIKKIRELKQRPDNPFSVWVPSLNWIKENCEINEKDNFYLKKLPGPYTLITKIKNKKVVDKEVNPKTNTLGIRMPDHWFSQIVADLGFPLITTSVNKSNQSFMTSLENLDINIKNHINFIIYEGEKKITPSKIINLTKQGKIER